jgi:hypothetical protein
MLDISGNMRHTLLMVNEVNEVSRGNEMTTTSVERKDRGPLGPGGYGAPNEEVDFERLTKTLTATEKRDKAIRFRADIDKSTRTIVTSREVWTYKPESAQGYHGNDGEWQMRTRPGQYGFKNRGVSLRGSGGALVRATGEEVAGMPRNPDDAVEAFRATSQAWADRYTKQAQARLVEAAEYKDQATWPAGAGV